MRHQRTNPAGMAGGEVEPDLGAAAGAEHIGRSGAKRLDQSRSIVAMDIEVLLLRLSVEGAARIAARIIGDHRVAVGEVARDIGEDAGVLRSAGDYQQYGAGTAHLIIEAGARYFPRRRLGVMSISPVVLMSKFGFAPGPIICR